jgi:hypothetical protein
MWLRIAVSNRITARVKSPRQAASYYSYGYNYFIHRSYWYGNDCYFGGSQIHIQMPMQKFNAYFVGKTLY